MSNLIKDSPMYDYVEQMSNRTPTSAFHSVPKKT